MNTSTSAKSCDTLLREAKTALSEGENFLAYDIAEKIPDKGAQLSPEKIHVMALALARSGSLKRARALVAMLPDTDDTEIVGLKSRIFKDMALAASNAEERRSFFLKSARMSSDIFLKKRNWYNGINAASCLFMAGDREASRRLVRDEVLPLCRAEANQDVWLDATIGECNLLLGDFHTAAVSYRKAVAAATATGQYGSISSTLRQLRMLIAAIGDEAATLWNNLSLPRIAVFSGHMIDRPGRQCPRFPPSAEEQVRHALREVIDRQAIRIAFASCACGGDILFLEEVLSAGGECFVVPPLPLPTTIQNSVAFAPGGWETRLEAIRAHPKSRFLDPECDETGENDAIVYDFANRYLLGLALLKTRALGFPLLGVCVWDGKESGLAGGTDSAVRMWREHALPVEIVKPEVPA